MDIFLDIGAHKGMSTQAALNLGFDHVHAFEPMPREFDQLTEAFGDDARVTLHNFGLSNHTIEMQVFGTNDAYEASVYRTSWVEDDAPRTLCDFVDASEFFATLPDEGRLAAKMNCEGSEADILQSLIDSGQVWKLDAVLVAFDIALVQGQGHRVQEIRDEFERIGFHRWHLMAAYPGLTCLRDWLNDIGWKVGAGV